MTQTSKTTRKSKLVFCWLALLTGSIGGHWIYMRDKRWIWYVVLFPLSAFAGWIDAMRFGLMSDAQFNERFNPSQSDQQSQTTPLVVIAVILSLSVGTIALMSSLAVLVQLYLSGYAG